MTRKQLSLSAVLLLVFSVHFLLGCNHQGGKAKKSAPVVMALEQLTTEQQQQKEMAIAAKDRLFDALLTELMKSMTVNGPAKSIKFCKERAPEITAAISKEEGLKIGRTSFRLRNGKNAAPDWAAKFVEDKIENPVEVALPEGHLGVLMPIRLKPTCVLCHGTDEKVIPNVKAAIVSNYPDDAATGFSVDDVRGYFWIDVPASSPNEN